MGFLLYISPLMNFELRAMNKPFLLFLFILTYLCADLNTLEAQDVEDLSFQDYNPRTTLVVPGEEITSAKYPFIDIHSHLWRMATMDLEQTVREMDSLNLKVLVNLSGRSGEQLLAMKEAARKTAPDRFIIFANVDFSGMDDPNWTENAVAQLRQDYENGARGLKIFKNLGLTTSDNNGERIRTDDPRIGPVWDLCGELGIPVLIHTGEPAEFWAPIDEKNERLLEMIQFPSRHRGDSTRYPDWETVMQEQWNVFENHPNTTFINAHLGWMGNDLERLGKHLDKYPNVYTEIAAVIAELGRQPRFAREFFIKYQDRILFGKDTYRPKEYHTYFRVLESDDEYFDYFRKRHAFWKMYGLNLPDEVLKKVYYKNALKILPDIDPSLFPSE